MVFFLMAETAFYDVLEHDLQLCQIWNPQTPPKTTPLTPQKSNSWFIVRFWLNLRHNICICLPMINEIILSNIDPLTPREASHSSLSPSFWWNLKQQPLKTTIKMTRKILGLIFPRAYMEYKKYVV